jgi:ribonuclease BN (tRNA processing enzyme)
MEVLVLGKSPSWPDAGGACSGYLVREDGFSLLLDCGTGVFSRLRAELDYLELDAIVLTHLHPDHFLDLFPFASALSYSPRVAAGVPRRPALHVPAGARGFFRRLTACWGQEGQLEEAFAMVEYGPEDRLRLGPLTVRFCEVPHFTPAFACQVSAGEARFTFGADCAPNQALEDFARGSDLLMLESTLLEPEASEDRGHMTSAEAGGLARRAGAGRLLLTHFSDELDAARLCSEASHTYGGEVELAADGQSYTV